MSAPAQQAQDVAYPVTKGITVVLAGFGIATWGDVAALLAALYSACLLGEWIWKKLVKPKMGRK